MVTSNLQQSRKRTIIKQLQDGVLLEITDPRLTPAVSKKYTIADMITGYGVSEATKHFYNIHKENLIEKRVIIQGWGMLVSAAAFYLSKLGAKIVGIIDKEGGLINENGF